MDKDLRKYVMLLQGWIDPQTCLQTVSDMHHSNWQQHTFYNPTDGSYGARSGSRELDISYCDNVSTKKIITQRKWDAYRYYLDYHKMPWFNSWAGFSEVRFNKYSESRLMAEHCDHIHSMFDGERKGIPTMSCLTMLNDDYGGGDLIMWGDTVIPMKGGDTIVFPSCFLYPHRVEPVTWGTRYSCVAWAY
jgi:hypothetical protein